MSLGGKQETSASIPPYLQQASQDAIAMAGQIGELGYVPYYGPDVAALNDTQLAAMENTGNMAASYGMAAPEPNMPAPQTFAGGVQGYSSAPLYEESMATLQAERPGQYDAINSFFIDPVTGAKPGASFSTVGNVGNIGFGTMWDGTDPSNRDPFNTPYVYDWQGQVWQPNELYGGASPYLTGGV